MKRRTIAALTFAVALSTVASCASPTTAPPQGTASGTAATSAAPRTSLPTTATQTSRPAATSARPTSTPTPTASLPEGTITLAFAGDANAFELARDSTELGLGEAGQLLASADFAMVNLETALADDATGLTKQPKLYTFLTDSEFPRMLQAEGVDLVSLANNHAMDFGVTGMQRTLAIREASSLPMIGVGATEDEAFAPFTTELKGRRLSVFVGNDILESNMDWRPRGGRPGVAMIKTDAGLDRLVTGVADARRADPDQVIVVYVHWGIDYQVCTSPRQQMIAKRLAEAGATIVVGTHAHRVQRTTKVGDTLVAYGLGNFNFHSTRVQTRETGVLTVTIDPSGATDHSWAPGRIVDGRPQLLTGDAKAAALGRYQGLSC
ncbi:CapA family protein [Aestuariimicrobium ganziense]|uniref:CapA family protein n=1 Tax=Aestuariimicrobium ganziense TaxID=2773677 RepID=UPI0019409652|nr:CapA family protein [Aestuariimicrobium ganziense]